jgi:uncharacterized protein YjbI with pentapeptide repeats
MASQGQVDILKQGYKIWNQWRKENPDVDIDLHQADLSETWLFKVDLSGIDLSTVRFHNDTMPGGILTGAQLIGANLSRANLKGVDLTNTNLIGADLTEANLNEANLPKNIIAETVLTRTLLRRVDLSGVDLRGKDLRRADFSNANLMQVNLTDANLQGANLTKANLRGALLIRTNLEFANLNGSIVHGASVWNASVAGASQSNLIISDENEPTSTVDDLEIAQFISLLLNHKKLGNFINAVVERGVLLLGRFGSGGIELLQTIAAALRIKGYLPIIFDFERPRERDYTETVKILASLSRFIIADISGPSVPQELSHIVPFYDIALVPIIDTQTSIYSMFVDFYKYPWVVNPPIIFSTTEDLLRRMDQEIIQPAENIYKTRHR